MAHVHQQDAEQQQVAAEVDREREVEFYAAALAAFYTTSLEYDKGIFTLAAGGLGLLVTLLTTSGLTSAAELVAYLFGIAAFSATLFLLLWTFRLNKEHIVHVVQGTDELSNKKLKKVDTAAMCVFCVGVVCSAVVGVLAAIDSYEKVKQIADKTSTPRIIHSGSANGAKQSPPDVLPQTVANTSNLVPRANSEASASAPESVQTAALAAKSSSLTSATPAAPTSNPASNSSGKGK
ncbi:hypothetical protein JG536_12330 [Burkholderia ambifaria]|uniref:hypothetical protein n=1 Tax=Burkholderia ambifaria TaxID=152480 RepID=UPI00158907C7|nr:hypothetical protein [Burkholderia ambifaria]QQJ96400.1 hypothetical protein JG536_12330 [Burkholderia ambifaria]